MRPPTEYLIYIAGLALLGLFYGAVKAAFASDGWFLAAVVVYLIALRVIGKTVSRLAAPGQRE